MDALVISHICNYLQYRDLVSFAKVSADIREVATSCGTYSGYAKTLTRLIAGYYEASNVNGKMILGCMHSDDDEMNLISYNRYPTEDITVYHVRLHDHSDFAVFILPHYGKGGKILYDKNDNGYYIYKLIKDNVSFLFTWIQNMKGILRHNSLQKFVSEVPEELYNQYEYNGRLMSLYEVAMTNNSKRCVEGFIMTNGKVIRYTKLLFVVLEQN